ncbi:MAG: hypothetical protein K8T89_08615 [Planctomycetes bacterium]|nr:hypothetical protein [Planctomycetota bacterium]
MNRWKEIAKFFCGVEAFHAFVHASFWYSGTTITVFGIITETPKVHMWGAIANGAIALVLGVYAWRSCGRRSAA